MTAKAFVVLAMAAGFHPPQAEALHYFAWRAAGPDRAHWRTSTLDPCAHSWRGEGLFDVSGPLRRRYHRDLGPGCIAADRQVAWFAQIWRVEYPRCATRFAAGDLTALQHGWGDGRRC